MSGMNGTNGLTDKRRVFVEEYLRCWNGSEAARRAEYAYPGREAYRLLKNAEIQALIKERVEEKAMSANEVLAHLADIARFDAGQLLGKAGVLDWDVAKDQGSTRFVKKMKWDTGKLEIELYDRMTALEMLGKAHGLFVDRHEIDTKGQPLTTIILDVNRDGDGGAV